MRPAINMWLMLLLIAAIAAGCGGDRAVPGGTAGVLRDAQQIELRDVRLQIYAAGETTPLGFGESMSGGEFVLYQPEARGPLHLPAGDYAATLESVGPEPVHFPPEFSDPRRTPVRFTWSPEMGKLEISVPLAAGRR